MESDARGAQPGSLHAPDTAAASGGDATADQGGDGALTDDLREDPAGVRAASKALGADVSWHGTPHAFSRLNVGRVPTHFIASIVKRMH